MGIYIGFMFLLVPPSAHGKHWDWNFAKDGPAAAGCQANHEQQITSTPSNRNESCWRGNIARYIRYRSCMIVIAWWQEIRTVLRTWTSWKMVFDCAGMSCITSVCIYIYRYIYIYMLWAQSKRRVFYWVLTGWTDPAKANQSRAFRILVGVDGLHLQDPAVTCCWVCSFIVKITLWSFMVELSGS